MINFHLITKISGYDSGFRSQIVEMIAVRFGNISKDLRPMIAEGKWVAVELLLTEYLLEIAPYTQLGATNRLRDLLNRLKTSGTDTDKEALASEFLMKVEAGIEDARNAVLSPTAGSAYRASA